ncbi:unnamed protein product [Oppiella nova]|uniref:Innexin n=1 Tax=Oppiella nova TaxID=334625 RepID=A0A7R9QL91_9ACAR|nr:unnamed protein product [Oppiella nova]CAG2167239.1 unnamed protein product [Oppiella nova]
MVISDTACIDNTVFRLHYKATIIGLTVAAIIVSSLHLFGYTIHCMGKDDIPGDVMNAQCWLRSTFKLPVDINNQLNNRKLPDNTYKSYYQWVWLLLFVQAILFYIPRFIWRMWEGGLCSKLTTGLDDPLIKDVDKQDKIARLVKYIYSHMNKHNIYFIGYVICEVLNFVNVVGQLVFIDKFMGKTGFKMFKNTLMDQEMRDDTLISVFPRTIRCIFHKLGVSGDVQKHSLLCVLPLNSVSERIYIALWLWLVILVVISGITLIYRCFTLILPKIRVTIMKYKVDFDDPTLLRHVYLGILLEINKATIIGLTVAAIIVSSVHFFGDTIHCMDRDDTPRDVLNAQCWLRSTFKLNIHINNMVTDRNLPDNTYQSYYQWVWLLLFVQAIFFYTPRFLWRKWEGGLCNKLTSGLDDPLIKAVDKQDKVAHLANYLYLQMNKHNTYFIGYVVCEALNFANVVCQLCFIDKFMGNKGFEMFKNTLMDQEMRDDTLISVFPRTIHCTFYKYGHSGDVQRNSVFCVLPLNSVNEKIYIIIWLWLLILVVISGITLIYRCFTVIVPKIRVTIMKYKVDFDDPTHLKYVLDISKVGDWFLLYQLSRNITHEHFKELMTELSRKIIGNQQGVGRIAPDLKLRLLKNYK